LIERLGYAPYFLTVNSIVRFARSREILCQGRGSAANSAVCYVLGITSIDPERNDLLFERFVSEERREPPDIDVDFEHERREEVMQWVFETYGRNHAALCSTVIRYRARGAMRDVGKALGLTEDLIKMLSSQVWEWSEEGVQAKHAEELNLNLGDRRLKLAIMLAQELIGAPRHLSQHPGGFVLTHDRLDELVPIEPAAMVDRQVIEWDKDDIDALKFMKVDCLALGMLTCMKRSFDFLVDAKGIELDVATIPSEDPRTYAMIRKADTLGTFQIESRAQMSMLPRMKPRTFYDLVIEGRSSGPVRSRATWSIRICAAARARRRWSIRNPNSRKCWARRWGCRSSRSRRCASRSNARGSHRARQTSFGARWRPSSSPAGSRNSRTSL
jgi:error-prone DNA polymerase